MRLNGRKAIMAYLGRSMKDKRGWRKARRDYAPALHYLPGSLRVWALSEELNALDKARALSVADVVKRVNRDVPGSGMGSIPPEMQRIFSKIIGPSLEGNR